jgi:hypothetical protein
MTRVGALGVIALLATASCGGVTPVGIAGPGGGGNGGEASSGGASGAGSAGGAGGQLGPGGSTAGGGSSGVAGTAGVSGPGGATGAAGAGGAPYACDGGSDDGGVVLTNPDGTRQCLPPNEWHPQCGDGGVLNFGPGTDERRRRPRMFARVLSLRPSTSSACNGHLLCRQGYWPSAGCNPTARRAPGIQVPSVAAATRGSDRLRHRLQRLPRCAPPLNCDGGGTVIRNGVPVCND